MAEHDLKWAVPQILAGHKVRALYASGCSGMLCIGDFRKVGWALRETTRTTWGYRWLGPNPITVDGVEYSFGESLPEYDADWS